jgi:hypothetical protein
VEHTDQVLVIHYWLSLPTYSFHIAIAVVDYVMGCCNLQPIARKPKMEISIDNKRGELILVHHPPLSNLPSVIPPGISAQDLLRKVVEVHSQTILISLNQGLLYKRIDQLIVEGGIQDGQIHILLAKEAQLILSVENSSGKISLRTKPLDFRYEGIRLLEDKINRDPREVPAVVSALRNKASFFLLLAIDLLQRILEHYTNLAVALSLQPFVKIPPRVVPPSPQATSHPSNLLFSSICSILIF